MDDFAHHQQPDRFLSNDSETARLVAAYDWSSTPLGPLDMWPDSLKTATGLLLASPVPIVMLWGQEGIMIYNDAYSSFAGGRHPRLLGSKVREGWPEVAAFNDNVMRTGLAGGTLSYKNQELTLYRNGQPEQVWMDLDYSPVPDESGRPAGVMAIVIETTEQVRAERELRRQRDLVRGVLDGMTEGFGLLDRHFHVLDMNATALSFETRGREEIIGRSHWDLYPGSEDSDVGRLYKQAMAQNTAVSLDHRYEWENGQAKWLEMRAFPVEQGLAVFYRDVTERKLAEEALVVGNARFRAAIDATQGVLWTNDASGRMVGEQPGWAGLTGQAFEDYQGYGWAAAIHPDDAQNTVDAWNAAVADRKHFVFEHHLRRHDGAWRICSVRAIPVFSADGSVAEWVGVHTDVTEQRAARDALVESEDNYRNVVELNPHTTWTATADGLLDRVAERWSEWTGVSGLGVSWGEAMHPDDLQRSIDVWTRSVTTGEPYDIEHRARMVSGGYRWMHSRAYPRRDADGNIVKWYGSTEDIHERKHGEEALRASEEQFRGFAQAVPNQMWTARPDGYLDWFNDRVYVYMGKDAGMLDGKEAWAGGVHDEDLPAAASAWLSSLDTGEIYETQFRIRRHDGEYRWFLVRAVPILSPEGDIVRWIGSNTDIEDSKRQTAELALLAETLEEKVTMRTGELMAVEEALRQSQKMEAVGQLTGGLAHDFNNLLAGISGSLELIQTRIDQGRFQDVERYVFTAQEASKRAAALTHRLLAFSRRQTLDPKPTDVARLIDGMADLLRQTIGPAITLDVAGQEALWPTLVDPNQLENALLNLCINARDALPNGGSILIRAANIQIDMQTALGKELDPGDYVSLSVTDDGVGMPADVVSRVFEPFFTTKPIGVGTGLGLSMIYGFAKQSRGDVSIRSVAGAGTTVTMLLPRHAINEQSSDDPREDADIPAATEGETILVIDDEVLVRMLVVDVLGDLGYATIEAGDGPEGLKVLRSDARIDLLVTDVGLPNGMNGRQVADAARQIRPGLKVLFMTGYAENAVLDRGHLDPDMQVITKPFQMSDFGQRIRNMIGGG